MQPGQYSVDWNGTNNKGEVVAGGMYIYRIVAGEFVQTRKMILLK
jgi:flagellar hook assembly protein FlgD